MRLGAIKPGNRCVYHHERNISVTSVEISPRFLTMGVTSFAWVSLLCRATTEI